MRAFPLAGGVFVGFGQCGVGVDGAQNFVQAQPVFHGQYVLGQQVACVGADDGHAQNLVFARHGQYFHKAVCLTVRNRAVQVVNAVLRHLVSNALLFGVLLVQAHARDLGVNKGGPRDDRVVSLEFLKVAEQGVDCRIPGLVRRGVGELVGSGHIARSKNVGVDGLQVLVGLHRLVGGNAQLFQAVAR